MVLCKKDIAELTFSASPAKDNGCVIKKMKTKIIREIGFGLIKKKDLMGDYA